MSAQGFVYFVRGGDRVKIGWSRKVALRVSQLQTASAEQLELLGEMPGTLDTERALHDTFAPLRVRGEWFRAEVGLLCAIRVMCGFALSDHLAVLAERDRRAESWTHALGDCVSALRRERPINATPEEVAAYESLARRAEALLGEAAAYQVAACTRIERSRLLMDAHERYLDERHKSARAMRDRYIAATGKVPPPSYGWPR